jgi:hypothetical protein
MPSFKDLFAKENFDFMKGKKNTPTDTTSNDTTQA